MTEDARSRYARLFGRVEGTDRIQFFSDAVFAIAMTLLVLEIQLPEDAGDDLGAALLEIWPSYLGYVLSFAIIGINWVTHHRKFLVIVRFDRGLVLLNLLFLMVVAWVPFPTSLMADRGNDAPAVVLYAATVAALSLLQLAIWVHSRRARLMSDVVDAGVYRLVAWALLPVPIVFLASVPFALVWPEWTPLSWILILPISRLFRAIGERRADAAGLGDDVRAAELIDD
ncbi:MAG: DUF1211 domain-containing protein [Actinomycetales bacterium]|nr:DUF1211 domain-containing protein [Actinomycetales bacterium]